jgi:hypothetical protein
MTAVRLPVWEMRPSATSMSSIRTLTWGFFHGAALPDPARLLQGAGKFMRHVKLRPETPRNAAALTRLIDAAYSDIKARVENG